nr:nucleoside triphosphate pyrophosphohydrolase [bacterium]
LLEEAYEFVEVVHSGKTDLMLEELGDLFMQVVFHAQVAEENGSFDFAQVSETLCDKLLRRHPHVFGDRTAENEEQALNSWNEAKRKEGPEHSNLKNIPKSMPALIRSRKIQEIAGRVGFEWTDMKGALKKIDEELSEFKEAVKIGNQEKIEEELGDLLFVVVNATRYGRFCPEVALSSTNEKFIRRFQHVERRLAEEGRTTQEATLEDMDVFWDEAKELERE